MSRMLYVCHVDWQWIRQRPQCLAEALSEYFAMTVVYPRSNRRAGLRAAEKAAFPLIPLYTLPTLGGRLAWIARFNAWLNKRKLGRLVGKYAPDILWLSHPWQNRLLPENVASRIVYDCMDDYPAIELPQSRRNDVILQETALMRRVDTVFVTSERLMQILAKRYPSETKKLHLLRNGYDSDWQLPQQAQAKPCNTPWKVGYFGTIGRWIDFELLQNSLERFSWLEYHLFGPLEAGTKLPKMERLIYHGVVEHKEIPAHAASLDALIMPFMINEIVESVDPVKLYEYIYLHKPILSVYYPEITRFSPFVSFYSDQESFDAQILQIRMQPDVGYAIQEAAAFLRENDWKTRAQTARDALLASQGNKENV